MTEAEKISEVMTAIAQQSRRLERQALEMERRGRYRTETQALWSRVYALDQYYESLASELARLQDEEFERNADHSLRCTADRLNPSER